MCYQLSDWCEIPSSSLWHAVAMHLDLGHKGTVRAELVHLVLLEHRLAGGVTNLQSTLMLMMVMLLMIISFPSSRFVDQIFPLPLICVCVPRWRTHTVDMCVKQSWQKMYHKILMTETCLGFFNIEDFFWNLQFWLLMVDFLRCLAYMLYTPKSLYDDQTIQFRLKVFMQFGKLWPTQLFWHQV